MKHRITASIVAAGIALSLVLFVLLHDPYVRAGEDGTFANDCCGTVELSDGKMLLNDSETVRYTVAKDADGPYILPRTYVGAFPDRAFEVDGTRPVLKLRLDKLPAPARMTLYQGFRPYVFTRQAPRFRKQSRKDSRRRSKSTSGSRCFARRPSPACG